MNDFHAIYKGVDYEPVFSVEYYRAAYADLREAFGDDPQAYFQHFVTFGMSEGRQGKLDFSIREFLRRHTALQGKFGDDLQAYYYEILTNPEYRKELGKPYVGINVKPGMPME